ncbi:MAG: ribokinase [Bryobacteraceae bacterium]|nr:ribokinase [Bryobacteraceae bacterium]
MSTAEILRQFQRLSALVVGDICLDRWCTYEPATSEPSRETGIPRIGVVKTEITPGGGGTVASNLVALGAGRVAVVGAIGDDGFGHELTASLATHGIESELLVKAQGYQTFTYTKLLNAETGVEDQPRVDFINTRPLAGETERRLLNRLNAHVGGFDVVVVADQAETEEGGVVTEAVRELLANMASRHLSKVFWADSRRRPELFRGMVVKPNQQEAASACERIFGRLDYQALRKLIGGRALVVTHGLEGAMVVEPTGETWVRTREVEHPVDICGAGDSFSAGAAMALAVTGSPSEAARIGNLVASVTIMKRGTGTASPEEVLQSEAG